MAKRTNVQTDRRGPKAIRGRPERLAAPEVSAAIHLFRSLAARSGDTLLLAEGPPNPDAALLEICGAALAELLEAERLHKSYRAWIERGPDGSRRRPFNDADFKASETIRRKAVTLMRTAKKLSSVTPAGIYAKALLCRSSSTGASELARSLAEDLVTNPELRRMLWPAGLPEVSA